MMIVSSAKSRRVYREVLLMVALALAGFVPSRAGGAVFRVRADAPPGGNGSSWGAAFNSLHAALLAAQAVSQPEAVEIWIAAGTYKPDAVSRTAVFSLQRSNTSLLGGFAGNESSAAERNPLVHITSLSGDVGVVGDVSDNSVRVMVVNGASNVTLDGLIIEKGNANTVASNFGAGLHISSSLVQFRRMTFRDNLATGNGAGVSLIALAGETVFEDCVFERNSTANQGGAMLINANTAATIRFRGCNFRSNSAGSGGAITSVQAGALVFEPSPVSGDTVFRENAAVSNGGAIQRGVNSRHSINAFSVLFDGNTVGNPGVASSASGGALSMSSPTANPTLDVFNDCRFINNRVVAPPASIRGGGAISAADGALSLFRCMFDRNSSGLGSSSRGGAVFYSQANGTTTNPQPPTLIVDRCTFLSNNAPDAVGGGIYTFQGPLDVRHTAFHGNSAGIGGYAIYYDRPLVAAGTALPPTLVNCVFTGNLCTQRPEPDQFGSLCTVNASRATVNSQGSARIINCTFTANYGDLNAGVFIGWPGNQTAPDPVITNSIFHGNIARPTGQTYYSAQIDASNPPLIPGGLVLVNPGTAPTFSNVTHCAIQGLVTSASGNTPADPLFNDPDGLDGIPGTPDDDAGLRPNSPLIDVGSNQALDALADPRDDDSDGNTAEPVPLDLRGARRVLDVPGLPTGAPSGAVVDIGAYETPPPSTVSQTFWVEPAGGDFAAPANWAPRLPGPGDQMVFDLGASYGVSLSANAAAGSMLIRDDNLTLALNGRKLTLGDPAQPLVIGADGPSGMSAPDAAVLNLLNGSLTSIAALLANGPGTSAEVELSGTQWTNSGSSFCIGCVGDANLSIGAASKVSTPFATLGQQPGSRGVVDVFGAGSSWTSSLLTVVQSGALVVRDGGAANTGLGGLLLLQDGALAGNGSVTGAVLNFGTVAPGAAAPSPSAPYSPGTLTLNSPYQQVGNLPDAGQASGTLSVELGASANDRLVVNAQAQLAGGLFVRLEPGFIPPAGAVPPNPAYTATILDAAALGAGPGVSPPNDRFDVALFPGLPGGRYFQIEYTQSEGRQVVRVVQAVLGGQIQTGQGSNFDATGAPTDALLVNLDADRFPDLVLTTPALNAPALEVGAVTILRNRGRLGDAWQGFEAPAQQVSYTVGVNPVDVTASDFNADGRIDLAVANRGKPAESGTVQVLLNTTTPGGGITLAVQTAVPVGPGFAGGVASINYDQDTFIDLVSTVSGSAGTEGLLIPLRNRGLDAGAWLGLQPETGIPVGPGPTAVAAGNIANPNGETGPDVVVANTGTESSPGDSVTVLLNRGASTSPAQRFGNTQQVRVGSRPARLLLADLEGDKDTDDLTAMITVNLGLGAQLLARGTPADEGSVSVARILSNGSFAPAVSFQVGFRPSSVAASDLDVDLDQDLAIVTRASAAATSASVRVLRNDTPPMSQNLVLAPLTEDLASGGNGSLVTSADVDDDRDSDLVIINTDTLAQRTEPVSSVTVLPNLVRSVPPACRADFNSSGLVDTPDLTFFLGRFGQPATPGSPAERADFNLNGVVDTPDLTFFLGRFGQPCP